MNWQNDGDTTKSDGSINKLVNEVLLHPDFQFSDLKGFSAHRENEIADEADTKSTLLTSFSEASVDIEVPSGAKNVPSAKFSVTGLHYRPLLSILRSVFADPLAAKFHLSPYKMYHKSPTSGVEQRIYSEIYDSDAFVEEHDRVQHAALPPDDPDCKREKVIAAMMFWSDSTHLANFGTAKLESHEEPCETSCEQGNSKTDFPRLSSLSPIDSHIILPSQSFALPYNSFSFNTFVFLSLISLILTRSIQLV